MLIAAFNSHNENASHSGLSRLDTIGGFGLFLFLLFFQLNATVAYVGLAVVALVFAFQAKTWMPVLKRDPVAQVFLLIVLYILSYSVWASCEFPETAEDQRIAAFNLIHWLLFIPVAWQQFRHRKHINSMLLVIAASLLIRIIVNFDWADVWNLAKVERTGFGLALTVFAPVAGGTVLGLLLLPPTPDNRLTKYALHHLTMKVEPENSANTECWLWSVRFPYRAHCTYRDRRRLAE